MRKKSKLSKDDKISKIDEKDKINEIDKDVLEKLLKCASMECGWDEDNKTIEIFGKTVDKEILEKLLKCASMECGWERKEEIFKKKKIL